MTAGHLLRANAGVARHEHIPGLWRVQEREREERKEREGENTKPKQRQPSSYLHVL